MKRLFKALALAPLLALLPACEPIIAEQVDSFEDESFRFDPWLDKVWGPCVPTWLDACDDGDYDMSCFVPDSVGPPTAVCVPKIEDELVAADCTNVGEPAFFHDVVPHPNPELGICVAPCLSWRECPEPMFCSKNAVDTYGYCAWHGPVE